MSLAFGGQPSAGDNGGRSFIFTSFVPTTSWSKLYWGPSSAALPTAALDGTADPLTFTGIAGQVATWQGTTSWTNPDTGGTSTGVPIRVRVTVTGLGGTPWVLSTSVAGLDPGIGTGIGAVVNNISLSNFTALVQFEADLPPTDGTFVAINPIRNGAGKTLSSFTGGFYSAAP